MGEAKRRKKEIMNLKNRHCQLMESFSCDEMAVYDLAISLAEKLVKAKRFYGGCYHLAFFMSMYLEENGILVEPIVGWINDGTWEGAGSHAWIALNKKITDVSLIYTENSLLNPTGSLLVHDNVIEKGEAKYQYFLDGSSTAEKALLAMRNIPDFKSALDMKMLEHQKMISIAKNRTFDEYLREAPPGLRYADLCRIVSEI